MDALLAPDATTQAPNVEPILKSCQRCGVYLPLTDFPRKSYGDSHGRQAWCHDCHNEYLRLRRAKRRSKDIDHFASELIAAKQDARRVAVLCREIVSKFGGVESFAQAWHSEIVAVTKRLPGSRTGLRGFQAIAALSEVCSRMTPPPRDPEDMTRQQMLDELAGFE